MVLPSQRSAGQLRSTRRRSARRLRRRVIAEGSARRERSLGILIIAKVEDMTIVLLDVDGTLIRTGRAGSRAMNRAFEDLFGIAGAFDSVAMAGRTDRWILNDAAARAGVDLDGD